MNKTWLKVIDRLEKDKEKILVQKAGKKVFRKEFFFVQIGSIGIKFFLDGKPKFYDMGGCTTVTLSRLKYEDL